MKVDKECKAKQNLIEKKEPIRACIKVWQNIIDPISRRMYDSESLKALDGLRYGPVHEVTEITTTLETELLNEFKQLNPAYRFDMCEIHTDKEYTTDGLHIESNGKNE